MKSNQNIFKEKIDQLDTILSIISFQQSYLELEKPPYAKKLKDSFDDMRLNLTNFRHELEIAQENMKNLEDPKRKIVQGYVGRIFLVGNGIIQGVGSGTTVQVYGKKLILTAQHLLEKEIKNREIYFIPYSELSKEDYLPEKREEGELDSVNWEFYDDYRVEKLFLNIPSESKTTLLSPEKNEDIQGPQRITINTINKIKRLEKIVPKPDNQDILWMKIKNPEKLTHLASVSAWKNEQIKDGDLMVAGYPGGGINERSLAIMSATTSSRFKDSVRQSLLLTKCSNKNWNYMGLPLPVNAGMSGGPLFKLEKELSQPPEVCAIITGVDYETGASLVSFLTQEELDAFQ